MGNVGSFFFKDDRERTFTVTGERNRVIADNTQFFLPQLTELNVADMWCHKTMQHTKQLLKQRT